MGRPSNSAERREQIVWALIKVMGQRGYASATSKEIAEEAGLAPGLLHYHFGSKDEILAAAVSALERLVVARDAALREKAADAAGEVDAWCEAHLELGEGASLESVSAWTVIGAEAVRSPVVRDLYARLIGRSRQTLRGRLARAGNLATGRSRTADDVAFALLAYVEGVFRIWAGAPELVPKAGTAAVAKRLWRSLLEASARTARTPGRRS